MFRAVRRQKLADDIADQIGRLIALGSLGTGERLPSERELMVRFGVGRTTVREALLALHHRGLIIVSHGRRAMIKVVKGAGSGVAEALAVAECGSDAVGHLKDTRTLLEVGLAYRAAERATPENIRELDAALLTNRKAITTWHGYLKTDIAFHEKIAAIGGNPLLERAVGQILENLARHRVDMVHVRGANILSHDEHAAIAEAIRRRDPQGAADAMERHLLRSNALYAVLEARSNDGATAPKKPVTARLPRRKRKCGGEERRRSQL